MATPKRVWSNKKTVWEWKKWVWKVWDEIATYDWTWSKAEWQLTVYGNSWENLSWDDKLEVYDSSSATEIGTVEENQGWGWDVPCTAIWFNILAGSIKIGETKIIWYAQPEPYEPAPATVNLIAIWSYEWVLSITVWEKDENWYPVTATWLSAGTATVSIQDTLTGTTSINAASVSCAGVYGWVEIDEAQSDLNPTVWNNWTIKINNMPWAFTMSWSPEWICTVSEVDQANSSIIYTAEAEWDCTFTITDNTDNRNTASCNISVQPGMWMAIIFESTESQDDSADLEYQDTWETPTWYLPEATCFCKLVWFEGITDPDMNISFQYLNEWTGECTPTDLYLSLQDSEAEYPYCVMWEISTSIFSWWYGSAPVDVIYTDPNNIDQPETYLWTLEVFAMPTTILCSDALEIEFTQSGSTWAGTTPPLWFDWAPIDPETQINFRYEDWEGSELDFVTATLQANDDASTMDEYPWLIEVTVDWDAAEQEGITLDDNYNITVHILRSYDDFEIDSIRCRFPASE